MAAKLVIILSVLAISLQNILAFPPKASTKIWEQGADSERVQLAQKDYIRTEKDRLAAASVGEQAKAIRGVEAAVFQPKYVPYPYPVKVPVEVAVPVKTPVYPHYEHKGYPLEHYGYYGY